MPKHWSEVLQCTGCGMRFRSRNAEARHRHNFPVLCRPVRTWVLHAGTRRVTVRARNYVSAAIRARSVLDARCRRAGLEPPVDWNLELVEQK